MISAEQQQSQRSEQAVRLNQVLLNSLLNLHQEVSRLSVDDIIRRALREAVQLTHSGSGYLRFLDNDSDTMQSFLWSEDGFDVHRAGNGEHYPIHDAGVWADCARFRKPVIHNDYQILLDGKDYPEGHEDWIRHMSVPVIDGGEVTLIMGVGNKNTDYDEIDASLLLLVASAVWSGVCLRRAEEELKNGEAKLGELERLARLGSWRWDLSDNTLSCSAEAYRMFGYDPQGRPAPTYELFLSYVHPDDRERVHQAIEGALHRNQTYNIDYRVNRGDGAECFVHAQGEVHFDETGTPVSMLGTVQDVTERKQLEAQYLRAQRMETIGLLAGGIAHDLNNVLAPILMAVEILRASTTDSELKEIIDIITSGARRGADIIKQVLTFARGIEGVRMSVQLKHLIREVAAIARETFPRNIQVDVQISGDLRTVAGDPTQLHQVLLNLCVNARDAMPDGGKLTLSADNVRIEEDASGTQRQRRAGDYVMLQVSDTGTGISSEHIERIFEPFFTTKEPGKGSGLGLSTVLGIVRSYGGFVRLRTALGAGSDFQVYLPAADLPQAQNADRETELPRGRGEWILVVDDEPAMREMTEEVLRQQGYRVLLAADGTEAISLFVEYKRVVDLVITDIMMPFMDGIALTRSLRKLSPALRIIASTGVAFGGPDLDKKRALENLGVDTFLHKPYSTHLLLRAVHEALQAKYSP